ncbi:MAG TPA: hypothetical protein VGK87_00025 [Anaerolineae bacterium]|jgi:hypothetical protein
MMTLSLEVNRFLGSVLLDPTLMKSFFSNDRARAMQGFNFQPAERHAIMVSHARTLHELSHELSSSCGKVDIHAESDAAIDRFYQSVHPGTKRTPIHMEAVAQRVINSLPGQQAAERAAAAEKFAKIQIAS